MRLHPKSFHFSYFVLPFHIYFLFIFFLQNRNGDHSQIQLSLDTCTVETVS